MSSLFLALGSPLLRQLTEIIAKENAARNNVARRAVQIVVDEVEESFNCVSEEQLKSDDKRLCKQCEQSSLFSTIHCSICAPDVRIVSSMHVCGQTDIHAHKYLCGNHSQIRDAYANRLKSAICY